MESFISYLKRRILFAQNRNAGNTVSRVGKVVIRTLIKCAEKGVFEIF